MGRIHPAPWGLAGQKGLTDHTAWALLSQWPAMPGGMCLTHSCCFAFPFNFQASCTQAHRCGQVFHPSAPQRHRLCPALWQHMVVGVDCAELAAASSQKGHLGGSLRPQCCNPTFKAPLCMLWGPFMCVWAAKEQLRSCRMSLGFKNQLPFCSCSVKGSKLGAEEERAEQRATL